MKFLRIIAIAALAFTSAFGQAPTPPQTFITGDVNITYNTRTQLNGDKPKDGVTDLYSLNINVSNSALFKGTVTQLPFIKNTFGANQNGKLTYALDLSVINPNNPKQTRNVGKLYGNVPVDSNNVYHFNDGDLQVTVFGIGTAKPFDSKFSGVALGKPPVQAGLLARVKKAVYSIQKTVNGSAVVLSLTDYDKMEFQNHVVGAGPVQVYPEATVNGNFIYDYGRSAWHLDGITVTYNVDGRLLQDRLSGSIRWDENAGEYQFDVHVNEPPPSEASAFAGPVDESAFFSTDTGIPALVGTMKYKDTKSGDTTVASTISVNLTGNKITKQQTMYLCKLFLLSAVVPLNSD